jgi:hypothetical protein
MGKVKTKIFLMQSLDWVMFIAVAAFGVYCALYAERRELMATVALCGLLLVNKLGSHIRTKIAMLNVDLQIESRRLGKR